VGKVAKVLKYLVLLTLVLALALIFYVGDKPYKFSNSVVLKPPYEFEPSTDQFHKTLFVADLHADTFTFVDTFMEQKDYAHLDYPRARAGGYNLLTMSIATEVPFGMVFRKPEGIERTGNMIKIGSFAALEPPPNWFSNYARGNWAIERMNRAIAADAESLVAITHREDLQALLDAYANGASNRIGILISIEGAHILDGNLDRLDELYANGARMISLTHAFDNEYGGASEGIDKFGITNTGSALLERIRSLGMIIDIAHASPTLVNDLLDVVNTPVVYSHGGIEGTCDVDRNLRDAALEKIQRNGGIVAIGFWGRVVCGENVNDIARAMRHIADRIGASHIALGSDFDGGVKTAFDASGLPLLTDALFAQGFTEGEIRQIMGENYAQLLMEALPTRRDNQ
jgi:microsomal dipeptidase-like Zn-dependent dipeptidase